MAALIAAAVLVLAAPRIAVAQAWTPPAGAGSVSVSVQRIDNTGHRLTDGTLIRDGRSVDVSVYLDADYGVTDRLSISAGLPYVFARFVDPNPSPPFLPFLPVDQCRCWQHGWQDVSVAGRYNVVRAYEGALSITPSVAAGVPTHDYNYKGEAVIGRRLREMRFGIDAGYRLDPLTSRMAVSASYSYAIVERVLGIPNNRSNMTLEGSVALHRHVFTRAWGAWQQTHGGLRIGNLPPSDLPPPGDVNTPERLAEHDRLLRDNNFKLGVAVTYERPRFDVFASYVTYVSGSTTHAGRVFTAGISWPFQIGG